MFDHILNVGVHLVMFGGNLLGLGGGGSSGSDMIFRCNDCKPIMEISVEKGCTYTGAINKKFIQKECTFTDDIFTVKDKDDVPHTWKYKREENLIQLFDEESKSWWQFVRNKKE